MHYMFDNIFNTMKKILITGGRLIEYILTGESDFHLYSADGEIYEKVTDIYKAREVLKGMREYLVGKFGMEIKSPVIIELYSGDEFNLKGIWLQLKGVKGQYHYENLGKNGMAHMIYLKKGMNKKKFKAILAHELTHAFLRDQELMNCDRFFREGFARWVEYKTLIDLGLLEEADKIKHIKTWKRGKAVEEIFKIEKKVGISGIMKALRKT
ncbi:MAG: hypothetical protein K8T10_20960 [Candidatus Eremiobacteraeota bacterium]|nr:hypothetical protein [Candidatus Eremiobacteraeota bacterium]